MKKIFYCLFFLLLSLGIGAQDSLILVSYHDLSGAERNAEQGFNDTIDRLAPDFVTVSLCIADPTDPHQDYMGVAGHAFLRLRCPTYGLDYCYSYESATVKGNIVKLLRGELSMSMLAIDTKTYLIDYHVWKRAVHEYRINMPPEAELRLWEQMDNHMMTEREMPIDMVKFGCTNTILRYVEYSLVPIQIEYHWPEKFLTKSAMEIVEEHLECYPWPLLGIRITARKDFARMKAPKQKVIFPIDLLEVWSRATINGEPMLIYVGDLVEAEPVVVQKPWLTPQVCGILLVIICVGCGIWIFIRKRKNNQ